MTTVPSMDGQSRRTYNLQISQRDRLNTPEARNKMKRLSPDEDRSGLSRLEYSPVEETNNMSQTNYNKDHHNDRYNIFGGG
jgi:hypothetical protein